MLEKSKGPPTCLGKVTPRRSSPVYPFLRKYSTSSAASTYSSHSQCLQSVRPCAHVVGRVEWHMKEGETFQPVKHVASVKGKARHLLLGERVALNMLARCSGIATKCDPTTIYQTGYGFTRGWADRKGSVTSPEGMDTQVLSPELVRRRRVSAYDLCNCRLHFRPIAGFRLVEKYGMLVGGIDAHRHDLSSMIMLKDNHIWSAGAPRAYSNSQGSHSYRPLP